MNQLDHFIADVEAVTQTGFRTSEEMATEPYSGRWWNSEAQSWVYAQEGSPEAATEIERARCIAAVHQALADWPHIPSSHTKAFAAKLIELINKDAL